MDLKSDKLCSWLGIREEVAVAIFTSCEQVPEGVTWQGL
jgi:hypothetical protein